MIINKGKLLNSIKVEFPRAKNIGLVRISNSVIESYMTIDNKPLLLTVMLNENGSVITKIEQLIFGEKKMKMLRDRCNNLNLTGE